MSRYNVLWQIANAVGNENLIAESNSGKGPSPAIWSDCPWLALQYGVKEGFAFREDFLGPINGTTAEDWTITQVTAGTVGVVATEQGGVAVFDSAGNASAHDGVEAQRKSCMVKPAAGVKVWFEARVKMNDATDEYFFGLAGVDTTLIASGTMDDVVDKCGFYHEAASTDNKLSAISSRLTSEEKNTDVGANADGTYAKWGFVIDGLTRISFYRNGVLVATVTDTSDTPNAVMCVSFVSKIAATGADAELSCDWYAIAQEGGRA